MSRQYLVLSPTLCVLACGYGNVILIVADSVAYRSRVIHTLFNNILHIFITIRYHAKCGNWAAKRFISVARFNRSVHSREWFRCMIALFMAFSMTQPRKNHVRWKLCVFTFDLQRFCGISQMFAALATKYGLHDCHLIIGAFASTRQEEGEPKDCNFRFVKESFCGMLHRFKRPCFSITSHVFPIWRLFNLRFHCRCGRSSCRSPFKWLMLLSPSARQAAANFTFYQHQTAIFFISLTRVVAGVFLLYSCT